MFTSPSLHACLGGDDPSPKSSGHELAQPRRMCRPGRRRYQVTIRDRIGDRDIGIGAAGKLDFRPAGGIGRAGAALQDTCGSEQLRAMADGGNGFSGIEEVPDRFDNVCIEAQIFRRTAAGDDEGVVIFGAHAIESGVQCEIMTAFFGIGLVAFEIMLSEPQTTPLSGWRARPSIVVAVAAIWATSSMMVRSQPDFATA